MFLMKLCLLFLVAALIEGKANNVVLHRDSRAVTTNPNALWPNGIIYYLYDSSVTELLRKNIQHAMDIWENATCLRFETCSNVSDYVTFYNHPNEEYCTCKSFGHKTGLQNITIGYSCRCVGDLLHTIGHIIGLYHEHDRPDRDNYVKILRDNIEEEEIEHVSDSEFVSLSYQGVGYDYASIMHLKRNAYSRNGHPTLEVTNIEAYEAQGMPELGKMQTISTGDALRVNRMYSCPGVGKCERLLVNMRSFQQLATDYGMSHRAEVTAVNSDGKSYTLSTGNFVSQVRDDSDPVWGETLEFPINMAKWQFFHIKAIGTIRGEEKLLTMIETIPLEQGKLLYMTTMW